MGNLPVPAPRNFVPGEVEVGSFLNSLRDALTFALNPPIGEFSQTTSQTIATSTWTSVNFDTTVTDSYGAHSNSTNSSRYTAQVAGWYRVGGSVGFAANATGYRVARLAKNGTAVNDSASSQTSVTVAQLATIPTREMLIFLNAGDYVEVQGFQTSGGNLGTVTIGSGAELSCGFSVKWEHV